MAEKGRRGFASMDKEKQRAIASKGGRIAHQRRTAHEFTQEEAREAGRKGGRAAHERGTAHQFTPEEAREAGRKGGQRARHRISLTHTGSTEQPFETVSPVQLPELEWAGQIVP
jgi:general stress protein YciG